MYEALKLDKRNLKKHSIYPFFHQIAETSTRLDKNSRHSNLSKIHNSGRAAGRLGKNHVFPYALKWNAFFSVTLNHKVYTQPMVSVCGNVARLVIMIIEYSDKNLW